MDENVLHISKQTALMGKKNKKSDLHVIIVPVSIDLQQQELIVEFNFVTLSALGLSINKCLFFISMLSLFSLPDKQELPFSESN